LKVSPSRIEEITPARIESYTSASVDSYQTPTQDLQQLAEKPEPIITDSNSKTTPEPSVKEMIHLLSEKLKGLDMQIARLESRVVDLETQLNLLETQLRGAIQTADADIARSQNDPVQVTLLQDEKNRAYFELRVADVPEDKRWEDLYPKSSMAEVTDALNKLPSGSQVKIVCSTPLESARGSQDHYYYQHAAGNHTVQIVAPETTQPMWSESNIFSMQTERVNDLFTDTEGSSKGSQFPKVSEPIQETLHSSDLESKIPKVVKQRLPKPQIEI
jgi:hypothetical protein